MASFYQATVERYLAALERGDESTLAALFHPDITFTEHPNRLLSKGLVRDRAALAQAFAKGQTTVRDQRYQVRSLIEQGEQVALRVGWSATLNVPLGNSAPGDVMSAEFGMFLRFCDGKLIEQHNYDCFHEF